MAVLICRVCGDEVFARTRFEAEGECPGCGAEEGSLVEEDAYDPAPRFLLCEQCGFTDDSAVQDEHGERLTVDDDCPICEATLVPADERRELRDRPEYKVARSAAAKLVANARLSAPIDVRQIAVEMGLDVIVAPFDHDGMLVGSQVQVPSRVAPVVQRFVIAHEIGHYELRHLGDRGKVEPEANAFASELLLPATQLRSFVAGGVTIAEVARAFQVSRQAAAYAAMTNGLIAQLRR